MKSGSFTEIQRIRGGLCHLNVFHNEDRFKLLTSAVPLRSKTVLLKASNSYRNDNTEILKVRKRYLSLSADDSIITLVLLANKKNHWKNYQGKATS